MLRRIRNRSSTAAKVRGETLPKRLTSLSFETDLMSSHLTKLVIDKPPSGGSILTWNGIPLTFEVIGSSTIRSAGPLLNASTETTNAGRLPACSCPLVGSRLTNQISPRARRLIRPQFHHRPYCPRGFFLEPLRPKHPDHLSTLERRCLRLP